MRMKLNEEVEKCPYIAKNYIFEEEILMNEKTERELKALDYAWEHAIQDIYETFFDAHRYTAGTEDTTRHKKYLDNVERTLDEELEAVNKAYEEKRKKIKAELLKEKKK